MVQVHSKMGRWAGRSVRKALIWWVRLSGPVFALVPAAGEWSVAWQFCHFLAAAPPSQAKISAKGKVSLDDVVIRQNLNRGNYVKGRDAIKAKNTKLLMAASQGHRKKIRQKKWQGGPSKARLPHLWGGR